MERRFLVINDKNEVLIEYGDLDECVAACKYDASGMNETYTIAEVVHVVEPKPETDLE